MLPAQLQVPPVNTSPGIPVFVPMTSPTFQTPMSRLRYHNSKGIWNGKPGFRTVSPAWAQSMQTRPLSQIPNLGQSCKTKPAATNWERQVALLCFSSVHLTVCGGLLERRMLTTALLLLPALLAHVDYADQSYLTDQTRYTKAGSHITATDYSHLLCDVSRDPTLALRP